jgi:hypothetical protein
MTESDRQRAEELMKVSEIYRRLRAEDPPAPTDTAIDLTPRAPVHLANTATGDQQAPLPPPGPSFLRRMISRPLDWREVLLLSLLGVALYLAG